MFQIESIGHQKDFVPKETYQCRECLKSFTSRNEMYIHNYNDHKVACDVCNKLVLVKYLSKHESSHHKSKFECKIEGCAKLFQHKSSYKIHVSSVHGPHRRLKCPKCPRIYKNKPTLTYHLYANHSSVPKYVCEIDGCGYNTMAKSCIRQHYQARFIHDKFNVNNSVLERLISEFK